MSEGRCRHRRKRFGESSGDSFDGRRSMFAQVFSSEKFSRVLCVDGSSDSAALFSSPSLVEAGDQVVYDDSIGGGFNTTGGSGRLSYRRRMPAVEWVDDGDFVGPATVAPPPPTAAYYTSSSSGITRLLSREPLYRTDQDVRRICLFLCDLCKSFRNLSRHAQALLAATVRLKSLGERCRVYEAGDPANSWFILLCGSVRMDVSGEVVSEPGRVFGRRRGCGGRFLRRDGTCTVLEDATQVLVIDYVDDDDGGRIGSPAESVLLPPPSEMEYKALLSLQKEPSDRTEHDLGRIVRFMGAFSAFDDLARSCLAVKQQIARALVLAVVHSANTVIMSDGELYDAWSVIIAGTVQNTTVESDALTHTTVMGANDTFGTSADGSIGRHRGVLKTLCDNCRFLCVPKDDYVSLVRRYGLRCVIGNTKKSRSLSATTEVPGGFHLFQREPQYLLHNARTSGFPDFHRSAVKSAEDRSRDDITAAAPNRGTRRELLDHLVRASTCFDFGYVAQYILTHRGFNQCSLEVCERLLDYFTSAISHREPVVNIFLQWVAKFGSDFERSRKLGRVLDDFIELVYAHRMHACLRLLAIASTAAHSSTRSVVIPRNNRDEKLCFEVAVVVAAALDPGHQTNNNNHQHQSSSSVFVVSVQPNSRASANGLKRGDEILEVNGYSHNGESSNCSQVLEIMRQTTHLCLKVRFNLAGYYEMVSAISNKTQMRSSGGTDEDSAYVRPAGEGAPRRNKLASIDGSISANKSPAGMMALSKRLIGSWLVGSSSLPPSSPPKSTTPQHQRSPKSIWRWKRSRPSTPGDCLPPPAAEHIDFVIKIFTSDEAFKLLRVNRLTSAHEAASAALCSQDSATAGVPSTSGHHQVALYELSHDNLSYWRQRRLPDQIDNLAGRLPYGSRYFVRSTSAISNCHNSSTTAAGRSSFPGPTLPQCTSADQQHPQQQQLNFLAVDTYELASQLSLRAYSLFGNIRPQEYVCHVFNLTSSFDKTQNHRLERSLFTCDGLTEFSNSVNKEMYWVVSEVIREPNTHRRALVIKKFIKLASICRDLKNFNSVLTIVSGLGHKAVTRLHRTWAGVSDKAKKNYAELQSLLDPSRNMLNYRSLFRGKDVCPPIIPMFPICIKDLVFIHQANPCVLGTKASGGGGEHTTTSNNNNLEEVINFGKFKRLSEEIDLICQMKRCHERLLETYANLPVPFWLVFRAFECGGTSRQLVDRLSIANYSPPRAPSFENGSSATSGVAVSQSWLKKRYEQTEKTRQAKAYLDKVEVISDEKSLLSISVSESIEKQSPVLSTSAQRQLSSSLDKNAFQGRGSSAIPATGVFDLEDSLGSSEHNSSTTTTTSPALAPPLPPTSMDRDDDDDADSLNERLNALSFDDASNEFHNHNSTTNEDDRYRFS